jgi:hypothetical protein
MAENTPNTPSKSAGSKTGKPVRSRQRGANLTVGKASKNSRSIIAPTGRQYASAGRYTHIDGEMITEAPPSRRGAAPPITVQYPVIASMAHTANFLGQSDLGPANIADSDNIGYYSFEFPVDALMLPASRPEEIRYYRLAYDRDPIVARAIDMHTEIPLSKMVLEKPKCSNQEFADYVFDYYQGLVNRTKMFPTLIDMVREYWTIGEAFLFIEDEHSVKACEVAQNEIKRGKQPLSIAPLTESQGQDIMGEVDQILDNVSPGKRSSLITSSAKLLHSLKAAGIECDLNEDPVKVSRAIKIKKAALTKLAKNFIRKYGSIIDPKTGKLITRPDHTADGAMQITAAPGDPVPTAAAPGDAPAAPVDEGAPAGEAGTEGVEGGGGGDLGDEMGGAGAPLAGGGGGGGGLGGGPPVSGDQLQSVEQVLNTAEGLKKQQEIMEMRRYLRLLEKKKTLLEELKDLREKKRQELELFSHITNHEYDGFDKIQVLPPEQIEIAEENRTITAGPEIFYKPPETQKQVYLEDPDVPQDVKDKMEAEGKIALNQDAFEGSYVLQFARKKSGYELHGRSVLQRCLRTILYRDKLRQVQMTIASRNMTPKTLVIAPDIPASEVQALRAHIDEAKADPDYTIVVNYDAQWNEIGSEGRLLSLDSEWTHTNSDLAIGLGLSPDILMGEALYSGSRIQLEIMNVSYLQFRDTISTLIEQQIFLQIAMKKGFYEMDKYGRPRWIYPKVSFSRMALRDSGDLFDMLYNLFSKGSLPASVIYEFLNLDTETMVRQLEQDLFTVNDSNFNDMKTNIYSAISEYVIKGSDAVKRAIKGMGLDEMDEELQDQEVEGSGEGMG